VVSTSTRFSSIASSQMFRVFQRSFARSPKGSAPAAMECLSCSKREVVPFLTATSSSLFDADGRARRTASEPVEGSLDLVPVTSTWTRRRVKSLRHFGGHSSQHRNARHPGLLRDGSTSGGGLHQGSLSFVIQRHPWFL
jgi:hypothetical protein